MTSALMRLMLATAALAPAAACAQFSREEKAAWPEWFAARVEALDDAAFPKLADVPPLGEAPRDERIWRGMERELRAAGLAIAENPRNVPADTSDLAAFERAARAAIAPPAATAE